MRALVAEHLNLAPSQHEETAFRVFFTYPEDAGNDDREVLLGEYEGTVRVPRRVFQRLLDQSPTPQGCLEAFHLQRTRFEQAVERKLRRRQLTEDGNVEITGRELRERDPMPPSGGLARACACEAR